jgi:predicted nucleotidyltransferase
MGPASEIGEPDAARLAEVLDRLAAVTVAGSFARSMLVSRLESLLRLFEACKSETLEGLVRVLAWRLATLDANVTAAALFGSAARDELEPDSDVDLLLIADGLSQLEAQVHFKAAGRELRRAVNLLVFAPEGWLAATTSEGSLAQGIRSHPIVPLMGALPEA